MTVGLGTDAGPEAICYRPDLLKKAGLPSDPATLATKWTTWQDFIDFGKQYQASSTKQAGSHFVDSAASIFSTAVYQGTEAYDNAQGKPDVAGSDGVKSAWKYATDASSGRHLGQAPAVQPAVEQGVLERLVRRPGLPDLDDGLHQRPGRPERRRQVERRARSCPAAPTNWGGSWLGVPTAAAHKAAAVAFVEWATAKAQQVTMWTAKAQGGHWPSNKDAAEQPAVSNATNAYFSNAPVGQIFGKIAGDMKIPPIGLYDTPIQNAFTTAADHTRDEGDQAPAVRSTAR